MVMGGKLTYGTMLEAQGYAPDWPALARRFPKINGIAKYSEKWAYIEKRLREPTGLLGRFIEWLPLIGRIAKAARARDAAFIKANRPKIPDSYRCVIDHVVTDDFVEFVIDQLIAESSAFGDFKYHHSGTGTNAENATDSALQTPELDARTVGTQVEDSSKVYKSIATETFDDTAAIIEHGLFNTAGAGGPPVTGGILMDRTKLGAASNVVATNQIEWTFKLTLASGS